MGRKGKKRVKAKYRQPMRPAGPLSAVGANAEGAQAPQRSVAQARVGGDQALVRAVEMSIGARNEIIKGRGGRYVFKSAVTSIPLDGAPYFTKDLRRLGFVGVVTFVLLG